MKKSFYLIAFAVVAICACQDENSKLGQNLVDSSFYNVFVDTCTVSISTILMDSMPTRSDTICQLGRYKDSTWGEVVAAYYAEYSKASFTPSDDYSYSFDSLVLRLTYTGHYWGDTLSSQSISVYRISYPIVLDDDDMDNLYNTTHLPIDEEPLFSFKFAPRPRTDRQLEVRLPDELGQQMLQDIINEEDFLDTQEEFKEYFPGLAFVPHTDGGCINGFMVADSSMTITMHYKEISNIRTEKELTMKVNKDFAHTSITTHRANSKLEGMQPGIDNLIASTQMEHKAYLQGLTGLYNQIEFPYINNLMDQAEVVTIEEATLYLYPLAQSYSEQNQLPEDIRLYITDQNNVLEDYVYGSDGVTVQTGNLTVDDTFWKDTYYAFDVTDFVRNNFGAVGIRRQKLLLSLTDDEMVTTFNQVIFTNDPLKEKQCRLEVRFKTYNEKR